jgi:hypothetical protein
MRAKTRSMLKDTRPMTWWSMIFVASVLVEMIGCTRPNPASCVDGTCTDPSLPFCDVGGEIAGGPLTCIAVTCTPGDFATCRGDTELTCNSVGTDYDIVQCERGCDPAGGCRLCAPNQTVCTNGRLQTCDAAGAVISSEACSLGCIEEQPRCAKLAPSNDLAAYADSVQNPPDLELTDATFDTSTGVVIAGGQPVTVPNFLVARTGNGVPIRVFVVGSLKLTDATIGIGSLATSAPGPGLAIFARGDIALAGDFVVSPLAGEATLGCRPPGSALQTQGVSVGGGGGANATDGAEGGAVANVFPVGAKDIAAGTAQLVPLRGGCSGGAAMAAPFQDGGGAIQLSSATKINIDGVLDARGHNGSHGEPAVLGGGIPADGGGGGGSILLEAPQVLLSANAKLLTTGGNGCTACPTTNCGAGGVGATAKTAATKGMDVGEVAAASGGGGGGGVGRVRINTATSGYTKSGSTVEDAILTTGTISTR